MTSESHQMLEEQDMIIFRHRSDGMGGSTTTTVLGLAMGLFSLTLLLGAGGGGGMLGPSIGLVALGIWNSGRAVLTLHEDHFDMKIAPLRARQRIRYQEIAGIDEQDATKIFVVARGKRFRLPMAQLDIPDRVELLQELRTRREAARRVPPFAPVPAKAIA